MPEAYIVDAVRTPVGRKNGGLAKAHPADLGSHVLTELFQRAGLPPDVLRLVPAGGSDTYAGLSGALDAGLVDKVGFTGSTDVGRKIGELCGRHLQSPCLELGGKNPFVVTG